MRRFAFLCCAVLLVGCGRSDVQPAGDATVMPPGTPERQGEISLADVAGRWRLRTTDEAGGNEVDNELTATADTSGWRLIRPDGGSVPMRVAVSGDSIIAEGGPYESAVRRGVRIRARMVLRLQDDRLVGTTEARYLFSGGDSVAYRPTEGTRMP